MLQQPSTMNLKAPTQQFELQDGKDPSTTSNVGVNIQTLITGTGPGKLPAPGTKQPTKVPVAEPVKEPATANQSMTPEMKKKYMWAGGIAAACVVGYLAYKFVK